jgi:hypothetical protein
MNLPVTILKITLFNNLKNVKVIRGRLYIVDNAFISALTFLSNLVGVNGITLVNNPILVDARMPSLSILGGNVKIEGCDRLCPARYPVIGLSPNDTGCTNPIMDYFLHVLGPATPSQMPVLGSMVSRIVTNITNGMVCFDIDI